MSDVEFPRSQQDHEVRILAARKWKAETNRLAVQGSIDIAKEKVQYFEKIALGSGATIAAIVSFVGANADKMHTPRLLRGSLVLLFLVLFGAMYRNWRFPFYQLGVLLRCELQADQKLELYQYEQSIDLPAEVPISLNDEVISRQEWKTRHSVDTEQWTDAIEKAISREERIFAEVRYVEFGTLAAAIIAMALLISLTWINVGATRISPNLCPPTSTHVLPAK
jgi:hypothetical protein